MLWREGLDFRLRFIGGGSLSFIRVFDRRVAELRQGRRVEVLRGVDDAVLLSSYAEARFTVFPSLHEGYGLPVAESLAHGVPVVTSDYGSTAEIAVDGGCLTVDPRDDDAIIEAMRSLLVDDVVLDRLRAECLARPERTWDTYADELWNELVVPLQEDRMSEHAPAAGDPPPRPRPRRHRRRHGGPTAGRVANSSPRRSPIACGSAWR